MQQKHKANQWEIVNRRVTISYLKTL